MESPMIESKTPEVTLNISTSSSSNQFIPELELPDDTFRMSLDNFSVIGENVTIGRESSVDVSASGAIPYTPSMELATPLSTPDIQTPPPDSTTRNSPPIIETPKLSVAEPEIRKPQTLLQLSLSKKNENDIFVKPSPVMEVMSPAKMLQFEVEATSATPTMKRAAIDFDFFNKNKFDEYFEEDAVKNEEGKETEAPTDGSTFKETPVIVKADTVRHEIGYGTYHR